MKTSTEALQRQHGERITMLPEDWTSVIVQFKKKYGTDLQDEELPSQYYYEDFQERLSAGMLRAEPLDQVISLSEAELQDSQRPDPPRQYGIHLNAQLTLQTRKRYSSVAPKNIEELRAKYEVMSNMWLLAQLRQPGRSVFADLEPTTFQKFLKQLLSKQDFNLQKEIQGSFLSPPSWAHCLSYEFELRKEAYKQCRESAVGIRSAWWAAYNNQQHRMMHWLQLVSLANSQSSGSASSDLAKVQKELADLRNEVRNRSRTPNPRSKGRGGRGTQALTAPAQLALPAPSGSSNQSQNKSRGRGKKGGGKGGRNRSGKAASKGEVWSFDDLLHGGFRVKAMFHEKNANNGICFAFQEKRCELTNCARLHICIGCGGAKPYNDCHCLQPKINALTSASS